MTADLQSAVQRALSAWDTTTLKTSGDGMLSEAMESLRAEFDSATQSAAEGDERAAYEAWWQRKYGTEPMLMGWKVWEARAALNAKVQPKGTEPMCWLATRLWNARELWTCPADIEKMLTAQAQAPAQ